MLAVPVPLNSLSIVFALVLQGLLGQGWNDVKPFRPRRPCRAKEINVIEMWNRKTRKGTQGKEGQSKKGNEDNDVAAGTK